MSNVVFILGAGASKQCGGPLMADFLDIASDLLRAKQVEDKREHFTRVFDAIGGLQNVHSKAQLDLNNIESIFTALELGRIIQRVPGTEKEEIPNVIASLKELIVRTLEIKIQFPTEGRYIQAPVPYPSFADLVKYLHEEARPAQSVSVITFNYDIAVDLALYMVGLGPNYVIDHDLNSKQLVPLLKLHGSLNWATEKESNQIQPLHLRDYFQRYSVPFINENGKITVPIGSQLVEYFAAHKNKAVNSEPVIVPPSWNKSNYHQALSDVWAAAATNLSEAEYIFIIGYSLPETDSFFRHLYALGSVGKAALKQIIVFNPDQSGEVDTRFRALLGPGAISRYRYEAFTFERAIKHIEGLFRK